jgi:hypothetical protein
MNKAFSEFSAADAKQKIPLDQVAETNRKFIDGDHWQNEDGWVGPKPNPSEDGYAETMAEIKRAFVSRNVIAEIVERHVNGVLGKTPTWGFTPIRPINLDAGEKPNEDESQKIFDIESELKYWWDQKGVHNLLKQVAGNMLWSKRGLARLYIPATFVNDRNELVSGTPGTIGEALDVIWPDAPTPEQSTVWETSWTRAEIGIFITKNDDDKTVTELVYLADDKEETIIRILEGEESNEYTFNYGGRLTIFEATRPLLITRQVQEAQRALNLAASMVPRNVVTGGFLERVLLNAQMPGQWEKDSDGNKIRFVPDELHLGPGTTNFIRGIDYVETDPSTGREKPVVATPNVKWRPPTPVTPSVEAKRAHYTDMLEECDQAHILTLEHANASGRSREQARADYITSLWTTKNALDSLGRWLLEATLAMAEYLVGSPGIYTNEFRATFSCRIDGGPISVDEKRANVDSVDKNALARRTAMMWNGVDDVDAELRLISEQEDARLDIRKKQADAISILVSAGLTIESAARLVGMNEEEIAMLEEPEPSVEPSGDDSGILEEGDIGEEDG